MINYLTTKNRLLVAMLAFILPFSFAKAEVKKTQRIGKPHRLFLLLVQRQSVISNSHKERREIQFARSGNTLHFQSGRKRCHTARCRKGRRRSLDSSRGMG